MKSVGIEFVANTRKALQAVDNFKKRVGNSMDAIAKSTGVKWFSAGSIISSLINAGNTIKDIYETGDFARSFDLPVEEVGKFTNAVKLLGGSSDDAFSSMSILQKGLADLRTEGKGVLVELAQRTGLSVGRLGSDFRTAFDEIRRAYKRLGREGKIELREKLGLTSPAMIKMLEATNEEYEALLQKAEKPGVANAKSYRALDRAREAFGGLKTSMNSATMSIVEDLVPAIDKVSNFMDRITQGDIQNKKGVIWSFLFAGTMPLMLKILASVLSLPGALATLGGLTAYGVNKMGAEEFGKRFLDQLMEIPKGMWKVIKDVVKEFAQIPKYILGAIFGNSKDWFFGLGKYLPEISKDPWEEISKSIKSIKQPTSPLAPQYARSMISDSGAGRNSWLNSLLMSGNTFNININADENPYETTKVLINEIGATGGFKKQ